MDLRRMSRLVGGSALPVIAAAITGQSATARNLEPWYAHLEKPPFNPPNSLFGPVWTALYALMTVAVWRILRKPGDTPGRTAALRLYYAELALNGSWPAMFFGLRSARAGLANIIPQWLVLLATIERFRRIDPAAAACLAPLAAWITFAVVLNIEIWRRNR
jgi:tryptophan-rich sensory protein